MPAIRSARKPPEPALKRSASPSPRPARSRPTQRGLEHGQAIAAGSALTRDLANLPANVCTPSYLAQQARNWPASYKSVRTQVLEERDLKRLKMGSFLSVTSGTDEPAKLIVMRYDGGRARPGARRAGRQGRHVRQRRHLAEAAAGHGRDEVRHDRRRQRLRRDQGRGRDRPASSTSIGIVPACENMPSGRATKPGDIVRSMSGQTIEVINTDAEGRLILCDALTYARRFKPAVVVDIATLTGACVIALGAHLSAVMSNDDELAAELTAAGRRAEDRAWHMPMAEEYHEQLKSNFADFANACGRDGGAITAACFLAKFTDGLRWAHLDIAGTAYLTGVAEGQHRPPGAAADGLPARPGLIARTTVTAPQGRLLPARRTRPPRAPASRRAGSPRRPTTRGCGSPCAPPAPRRPRSSTSCCGRSATAASCRTCVWPAEPDVAAATPVLIGQRQPCPTRTATC